MFSDECLLLLQWGEICIEWCNKDLCCTYSTSVTSTAEMLYHVIILGSHLESSSVFTNRLDNTGAFKPHDDWRLWGSVNNTLPHHQIRKVHTTEKQENYSITMSLHHVADSILFKCKMFEINCLEKSHKLGWKTNTFQKICIILKQRSSVSIWDNFPPLLVNLNCMDSL